MKSFSTKEIIVTHSDAASRSSAIFWHPISEGLPADTGVKQRLLVTVREPDGTLKVRGAAFLNRTFTLKNDVTDADILAWAEFPAPYGADREP